MHPNPPHFPVPSYLSSALATSPPKENKTIQMKMKEKQTNKQKESPSGCCGVSHCVTQSTLLPNSFACKCCEASLVWFEASGFCYTLNAGATWGFLSDIQLLPCVKEILQLWLCLLALIIGAVMSLCLACLVSSCACTGQRGLQAPCCAGSSAAGVWNDCVGSSVFLGCWFSPGRKV